MIGMHRKLGKKQGGIVMTREEILEKSRMEKSDEGMREAENRGRKVGITAF